MSRPVGEPVRHPRRVARGDHGGLRRAYRLLALEHHPDAPGQSAPRFAKIAEAYGILSDATARAAYDAHVFRDRLGRGAGTDGGGGGGTVAGGRVERRHQRLVGVVAPAVPITPAPPKRPAAGAASWRAPPRRRTGGLRPDPGSRRGRARRHRGGHAVAEDPCPTCGGVAHPRGAWCRRCEFAGQVTDEVSVACRSHARSPTVSWRRGDDDGASGEAPRSG